MIAAFLGYSLEVLPADAPLGLRIASKRRRLGLSEKALARSLGLDDGTVRKWERGESQRRPSRRVRALFHRWLADSRQGDRFGYPKACVRFPKRPVFWASTAAPRLQ
jgi:transcriptional regulator with XRE-family HTH domain